MIPRLAVLFGINSTRNATNSTRLRLVLLRASLVLLIPNSMANHAITYTYTLPCLQHQYQFFFVLIIQIVTCVHEELQY